jgi:hypothetical protein
MTHSSVGYHPIDTSSFHMDNDLIQAARFSETDLER